MAMHKLAFEAMLMDTEYLSQTMRFMNLEMSWLVRLVDPRKQHPWKSITLPLPDTIPEMFAMQPEWLIEDIVEFFIFLGKYVSSALSLSVFFGASFKVGGRGGTKRNEDNFSY